MGNLAGMGLLKESWGGKKENTSHPGSLTRVVAQNGEGLGQA